MIVVVNPIRGLARISEMSECRVSDNTQAAQAQFSRQETIINIRMCVRCCVTRSFNGRIVCAIICEVLCYNGRFEEYKGLYGIERFVWDRDWFNFFEKEIRLIFE